MKAVSTPLILLLSVGCATDTPPSPAAVDARVNSSSPDASSAVDGSAPDAWSAPDGWRAPDAWTAPDAWSAPDATPIGIDARDSDASPPTDTSPRRSLPTLPCGVLGFGEIEALARAPGLIAVAARQAVRLLDDSGRSLAVFPGTHLQSLAFSPDAQRLAIAGPDAKLRRMPDGVEIASLGAGFTSAAFSRDGATLALAHTQGHVALVDGRTGLARRQLALPRQTGTSIPITGDTRNVAFTADGDLFVWGTLGAVVLKAADGGVRWMKEGGAGRALRAASVSPDGTQVAIADDAVRLLRTTDGTQVAQFAGIAQALSFSADGARLFVDRPGTQAFPVAGGSPVEVMPAFPREPGAAEAVAFQPGGNLVRDVVPAALRAALSEVAPRRISALALSPNGRWLVMAGFDVRLWDVRTGKLTWAATDGAAEAAFTPDGRQVAFRTGDARASGRVRLVDTVTGTAAREFADNVTAFRLSPDGAHLVALHPGGGAVFGGTAAVWRLSDGTRLRTFEDRVFGRPIFNPAGTTVALPGSTGDRGFVAFHDWRTGQAQPRLDGPKGRFFGQLAYAPDGTVLAIGRHGLVGLPGRELLTPLAEGQEVLAWVPVVQGSLFAVASQFETLLRSSVPNTPEVKIPLGAMALALGPDGERLAVAQEQIVHLFCR